LINVDLTQLNRFILRKQHLTEDSRIEDILQIAEDLCGLHATDTITPYLSLFSRVRNFSKKTLEKVLYKDRNLGRIRFMRNTLFLQTKPMIPIFYKATRRNSNKWEEKFLEARAISLKEFREISKKIIELLKGKELPTSEIKKNLNTKANISEIISLMCYQGILVRSRPVKSWKDRRSNYAIFSEYFPDVDLDQYSQDEAISQLVLMYLNSYAPMTVNDIIWWTGLTKTEVNNALNGIANEIEEINVIELSGNYLMHSSMISSLEKTVSEEENAIRLLPLLDPYPMGYKERERYLNPKYSEYAFDRSGNITSTIFLDGKAIGIWDATKKSDPLVKIFLFEPVEDLILEKINSEAKNIGKFLIGEKLRVKYCKTMVPLTKRTAGGFMTPLKDS